MDSLTATETSLRSLKDYLLNELEELTQEIEDLLTDDNTDTTTNCKILRIKRNEVHTQYMQTVCELARIEVRKEIIRSMIEKGLTEEAAVIFAKQTEESCN